MGGCSQRILDPHPQG